MAGGSTAQPDLTAALANAQSAGTAGTAGGATAMAELPQWQKGLMGALTGDPRFGKNAPVVSALVQQGLGLMSPPQVQSPGPLGGAPAPGMGAPPGMPQRPLGPGMGQQQPNPWGR